MPDAAVRILQMIDRALVPAYVTWEEKWAAARDATELLIRKSAADA
jgi:hypothetical protein